MDERQHLRKVLHAASVPQDIHRRFLPLFCIWRPSGDRSLPGKQTAEHLFPFFGSLDFLTYFRWSGEGNTDSALCSAQYYDPATIHLWRYVRQLGKRPSQLMPQYRGCTSERLDHQPRLGSCRHRTALATLVGSTDRQVKKDRHHSDPQYGRLVSCVTRWMVQADWKPEFVS